MGGRATHGGQEVALVLGLVRSPGQLDVAGIQRRRPSVDEARVVAGRQQVRTKALLGVLPHRAEFDVDVAW